MMVKRIASGLALFAVMAAVGSGGAQQKRHAVTVQLLAINDFHGNVEPPSGRDGMVNRVPAGGAEYLATHLRNAERENPNSLVVAAGDNIGGSPFISASFDDRPALEALNAMHLSVTSIGNHELDHGPDEFLRRIKPGCPASANCAPGEIFAGAHFQYLAANMMLAGNPPRALLPATAIRTVGGVKIGFIGETLEGTPAVLSTRASAGLVFLEESRVANAAAAKLERQGVHAIVLLIHQGGQQHAEKDSDVDPNGCVNFSSEFTALVSKLSPAIKVVVSGHTHQFYNCKIDGHIVTSAGSYGRLFTRINLSIDPRTDAILNVSATNEVVTRDVAKDPVQTAILAKFRPRADQVSKQIEGSITAVIEKKPNEAGESPLGDAIADAQLAGTSPPDKGAAVIAFTNSGGIRTDLVGTPSANGLRDVSYGDLAAVQPFSNRMKVVIMTGALLRRLLEQQFETGGRPTILQVSDGFTYQARAQAPAGQHIVEGSMMLHGRPIAATDELRVAASDFLAGGGDGMTVFREAKQVVIGDLDLETMLAYFHAHSPVAPGPQNRIQRID